MVLMGSYTDQDKHCSPKRMNIIDPDHVATDHDFLRAVIENHPLDPSLADSVRKLIIEEITDILSSPARIKHYPETKQVILQMTREVPCLPEYRYILLHEFTHIIDCINPSFRFSEAKKAILAGMEQVKLEEFWNVYIDSRLNSLGLFQLGKMDRNIHCMVDGHLEVIPFTIEGKMLRHTSFLRSRGLSNAVLLVKDFWDNPQKPRTFDDLISLATQ
jgi:hypothetical protein